jgi:hypothetical protein
MKFVIKGPLKDNVYTLSRKLGYFFQEKSGNEIKFVRPKKGFPRFHLILKIEGENIICNLHLDQKAPKYEGTPAHAREYESEIVKEEAERIKKIIEPSIK